MIQMMIQSQGKMKKALTLHMKKVYICKRRKGMRVKLK